MFPPSGQRFLPLLLCGFVLARAESHHAERALELQRAGKYEAAIGEYREALKLSSKQAGVWTNLGAALAHEGDFAEAIRSYQKALEVDSTLEEARLNLGLAYYKLLRWSDASEEFGTYHRAHPGDLRSGLLLADCSLQLGKYNDAIRALEPLEKTNPENLGVAYVLGTAYLRNKQEEPGNRLIARIMGRGELPEVHMMLGDSYSLGREYKKAVEEYRNALSINPKLPLAHLRIAETALATGDLDGALGDCEAEYAVNPNNFDLNFYLGYLHKQRGENEKAKPFLERAASMRPETYQPNFQLALLADARKDFVEARRRLERAVKEYPDEVEAHVVLARLYYRLGLKDEGKREQSTVVRLNAAKQKQTTDGLEAQIGSKTSAAVPEP